MSPEARDRLHHLETFLATRKDMTWLSRAMVLDECGSTQDKAFTASAGVPGLLVTALRQNKGRGRNGREWVQSAHLGLACTFVLNAAAIDVASLPIRVACSICRACEGVSELAAADPADIVAGFGIKWPNDVVVSTDVHNRHAPFRKLAGVLIERRDDLLLVGIGINVQQRDSDFPENLRAQAVSLAMLDGRPPSHESLLQRLIEAMDHFLAADRREIMQEFRARDVLTGTRQTFEHDQKRYSGVIEAIEPVSGIVLKLTDGRAITLPAMTTTLVTERQERSE